MASDLTARLCDTAHSQQNLLKKMAQAPSHYEIESVVARVAVASYNMARWQPVFFKAPRRLIGEVD